MVRGKGTGPLRGPFLKRRPQQTAMSAKPVLKPLHQQSIVITGATSGIGLATARKAARDGARVFLIARGEHDLQKLCEELQADGARVAYAIADVADNEALKEAADKCQRLFGGFDTWINNAGVSIYGPIRETVIEDQRRLFETNYWGVVNGSMIAVEHLRERPGGGTIINIGSVLSDAPAPIQGAYSASKHAVKGFTNALRMELMREHARIGVSLIKPSSIDTPYNRHARNLTGTAVRNPGPVYAPHVVAEAILHCATHNVREITVGSGGRAAASFYSLLPGLAEPLFARVGPKAMRDRSTEYRSTDDGLYDPTEDGLFEEVAYPMVRQFSLLSKARMHPGATTGGLIAVALIGIAAVLLSQRSGPTRLERIKSRIDPRNWGGGRDLGDRASAFLDRTRDGAGELLRRALDAVPADRIREDARETGRRVRKGARQAGTYAREHAKEGGALLALATIAAAVGAAAMQDLGKGDQSRLRSARSRLRL